MFGLKSLVTVAALVLVSPNLGHSAEAVLSIAGEVAEPLNSDAWTFSSEELRDLPKVSFETETIWTDGLQTFEGVSLLELLKLVGAQGELLRATAANDYSVLIPVSDAVEGGALVAYARNGEAMPLRDKGPLWIVYPYDSDEKFKTEEYYSRSIWQLNRIEVLEQE